MGLYIGASFLTLYELLDTVLFHLLTKTTKKQILVGRSFWVYMMTQTSKEHPSWFASTMFGLFNVFHVLVE